MAATRRGLGYWRSYYARRARGAVWRRALGGSRAWLAAGVGLTGMRLLKRITTEEPEILYRHRLEPGERFELVTSAPPPTRRQRKKAARRDAKRARRTARRAARRGA